MKLKSIVIPPNKMTGSGEKHAQDKNLIWCILMALRPILLLTVYRNALYFYDMGLLIYPFKKDFTEKGSKMWRIINVTSKI